MNPVLTIVAFASFVASLFIRMTDPLVPQLAREFAVAPETAALLSTAFALPWAFTQPLLGPIADLVGKTRVILVCMVILVVSAIVGALSTSFPLLIASRLISGAAAGGIFPVSIAVYGDLLPMQSRQIGMGRLLTASISGMMMGGAFSGVLADFIPWRGIFIIYGTVAALAFVGAALALRRVALSPPRPLQVAAIIAQYRQVLSNPRSKVCYGAVFVEGIAMIGLFPFVAVLLVSIGEGRASIAGLVLAAFPLGGVLYSLLVGTLVPRFSTFTLMRGGALLAATMMLVEATVPPWPVQMLVFLAIGFGFYLLHGSILVQMTELAPEARSTATAGHALAYFSGQSLGPVVYGIGFASIGASATIVTAAAVIALVGLVSVWMLAAIARRSAPPPAPGA